jgi:hypothetical protein
LSRNNSELSYVRIQRIDDPLFNQLHQLLRKIFPDEEVLEFAAWAQPLQDPGLRVYVAVHEGEVVGATEYRYDPQMKVAMTDFTVIGKEGLGIGPFLVKERSRDLAAWVSATEGPMIGMFAEIYKPDSTEDLDFGSIKVMHPVVRREVLSHLGYLRCDFAYVHPSWKQDGEAVERLDLGFLPHQEAELNALPGSLIARFLRTYYAPLHPKPPAWHDMIEMLEHKDSIPLLPL